MKKTLKHTLAFALIAVFAILGLGSMATTDAYDLGYAIGSALVGGDSSPPPSSGSSGSGSSSSSSNRRESVIRIVNNTGNQISMCYVRASDNTDWGSPDYLSLSNEQTLRLTYTHSSDYCDIKLVASNGVTSYTKKNIRINDGITVTFTSSDKD
jgi:hypothetical protein